MESVFKEVNSQKTRLALDEGIKEDVMLHQPEPIKKKVSDEAFEEEIREIDKKIKKYDRILTVPPGLVRLIQAKNLSVMFIAETWIDEARLDLILSKINFGQKWWFQD